MLAIVCFHQVVSDHDLFTHSNWFCDQLEPYKGALGHPWNGILEGHAIWHILCATGAVYMLSGCQLAALCARYSADYVEVRYSIGLPWLQRKGVSVSKQD